MHERERRELRQREREGGKDSEKSVSQSNDDLSTLLTPLGRKEPRGPGQHHHRWWMGSFFFFVICVSSWDGPSRSVVGFFKKISGLAPDVCVRAARTRNAHKYGNVLYISIHSNCYSTWKRFWERRRRHNYMRCLSLENSHTTRIFHVGSEKKERQSNHGHNNFMRKNRVVVVKDKEEKERNLQHFSKPLKSWKNKRKQENKNLLFRFFVLVFSSRVVFFLFNQIETTTKQKKNKK
jgi:hypothetical protein